MKIKKIILQNIGPYKNKEFVFEHPCTLIVDKNEAGKSIIANSIFEALYPSKQAVVSLNTGEITLEIEADKEFYQIIRNYKGYQIFKNGISIKYETKNRGKVIKKSPGDIIFNLPREIFQNSSFLMQKARINTKELYSITSFLEQAIDTGFQDASAYLALTKIKEALYESIHSGTLFPFNTKGKLDTAIKIWNDKLIEYKEKKLYLENFINKQTEIIKHYAELLSEFENINNELIKLDNAHAFYKIQKDNFYRGEIERLKKRNEEFKKTLEDFENLINFYTNFESLKLEDQEFIILYERENQNLQRDLTIKDQMGKRINNLFKKAFSINFFVAVFSIIGGIFIDKLFFGGIIACILILLYQIKLCRENKKIKYEIKKLQQKIDEIDSRIKNLISYFNISIYDKNELFNLFKKTNIYRYELKEFIENFKKIEELKKQLLSDNERIFYENKAISINEKVSHEEIQEYEQKKEQLFRLKENIKDKIHGLETEYEKIMQHKKEAENIEEQIQKITKYIETLKDFKKSLQKSFEILENITKKQHELWAEKLNERGSQLLTKITGKIVDIYFRKDLSFNIKVPEIEYPLSDKEIELRLSGGMIDQIYIAIRLILAEILSKDRKIPLILDEPFAHSDDERFIKGMKYLVEEIAKSNQVIILSCHQHRLQLLNELKGSFHLISIVS